MRSPLSLVLSCFDNIRRTQVIVYKGIRYERSLSSVKGMSTKAFVFAKNTGSIVEDFPEMIIIYLDDPDMMKRLGFIQIE